MTMQTHEILVRPIVTERASAMTDRLNQFVFEVHADANKHQIRDAIETVYGVNVEAVRTMMVPGKLKRRGQSVGKQSNWKKAVVQLKKGETIDFFAAE
jgi:large subunit ribosomal protein L23